MKIFTAKKTVLILLFIFILAAAIGIYKNNAYVQQLPLGCAFKAKALCAAIFVSGRNAETVEREDMGFNPLFNLFTPKINMNKKTVSCSLLGTGIFKRKAIHVEGLGPVLLSGVNEKNIRQWRPEIIPAEPAHPEKIPWPQGDLLSVAPTANVDMKKIDNAVAKLFSEENPRKKLYTRAIVVVHKGRIIAERYGDGITKDTPLLSWSIAKSMVNALIGIMVQQGKIDIRKPAAVPEWQNVDDPRRAITLDKMLKMSSGLDWVEVYAEKPISDVNMMLFLQPDTAAFAASKPQIAPPDKEWRYSSGTTNIICRIIKERTGDLNNYWKFPRQELFNKIGMRSAIWSTDATGTFIGSSFVYATARDYARFGLLYLNDGVWQGKRILPTGWVKYSTTPAPAAPQGQYGAHFWLNGGKKIPPNERPYPKLPGDTYFARGYQGQIIAVIPSHKLVVVRLGMTYDNVWGMEEFIAGIIDAVR